MITSVIDRVENIVGKGEITCTSNFSFSHNVFKRLLFPEASKGVIVWEWVNAVFKSSSVILQPVHLSMLSWSSFNQYSPQDSFQTTGCFPTQPLSKQRTAAREE